jgi:hypothetical protein
MCCSWPLVRFRPCIPSSSRPIIEPWKQVPGSSSQAARPHILPRPYLSNHTALPLSFPSSSIFPSLSSKPLAFLPDFTLLFFLQLCTSSSISRCLPLFSISLFFYLKYFPHLSFSISSSSSAGTLLMCSSSFYVLLLSFLFFIYLPKSFLPPFLP